VIRHSSIHRRGNFQQRYYWSRAIVTPDRLSKPALSNTTVASAFGDDLVIIEIYLRQLGPGQYLANEQNLFVGVMMTSTGALIASDKPAPFHQGPRRNDNLHHIAKILAPEGGRH
jgi:hypothetical protein